MLEKGYDRDAVQCRVKVKELRSAYCKAREGNSHSGAAPTTCRFYKELDAILGGDLTANPTTMMNTSERGRGGEEGREEETESEGTGVGGDTPESQEACSQELFSSQEEGSQSQQPVLGEGQAEERVPAARVINSSKTPKPAEEATKKQRRHAASSYGSLCQRE
ncbi:zinc finger and SCAN domain-containing protein 20-like [Gopherus flavomarginatus]|uniref:zinc finger and SCAN domain-containing protein 20-like n=1 Tax=Gopherus flavomarginatus TaxID=286002 RepID=UPI0021CBA97A|nr:zinc finger and SCAN domain-containing protein 20-like [Gopherus flavomarginatus]